MSRTTHVAVPLLAVLTITNVGCFREKDRDQTHIERGRELASRGDRAGAIAEYQAAIRLKPDYAEAHYDLANELFSSDDFDGGKAQYRMVVAPSTPRGLGAFLLSEVPFKAVPKEIPIHVSDPIKYPIILTIFGTGEFKINMDDTSNQQLGPRLNDIFSNRPDHVIWIRSERRLPFSELMDVTGTMKSSGIDTINFILN